MTKQNPQHEARSEGTTGKTGEKTQTRGGRGCEAGEVGPGGWSNTPRDKGGLRGGAWGWSAAGPEGLVRRGLEGWSAVVG